MRKRCFAGLLCALLMMNAPHLRACSTFLFNNNDQPFYGRNFDWDSGEGFVMVNKRGVAKIGMPLKAQTSPRWMSKYGSVTFNQYGREAPQGGMNEAGLVIEVLWLNETQYAEPDARPALDTAQWIQYQLDTAATVADVLASDAQVRITTLGERVHYFVCDASGACSVIELLDGQFVALTGDALPIKALANSPYAESVEAFATHRAVNDSLQRFAQMATRLQQPFPATSSALEHAFDMLKVVRSERTRWSIVYDIAQRRIAFRTSHNPAIRTIMLTAFDFSCQTPVLAMAINATGDGEISDQFAPYTVEMNRALMLRVFRNTSFLAAVPSTTVEMFARYPEQFRCTLSPEQ